FPVRACVVAVGSSFCARAVAKPLVLPHRVVFRRAVRDSFCLRPGFSGGPLRHFVAACAVMATAVCFSACSSGEQDSTRSGASAAAGAGGGDDGILFGGGGENGYT